MSRDEYELDCPPNGRITLDVLSDGSLELYRENYVEANDDVIQLTPRAAAKLLHLLPSLLSAVDCLGAIADDDARVVSGVDRDADRSGGSVTMPPDPLAGVTRTQLVVSGSIVGRMDAQTIANEARRSLEETQAALNALVKRGSVAHDGHVYWHPT